MKANYKAFIDRLIGKYEGGYSWHPEDPGGPTNFGITCYDLAEHRHMSMNSMGGWANLVRQMPESEAEDIYAEKYAKGIRFDELNSGVDVVMLDYAVNSGVERPIHVACTLIGRPVVDHIDDELLKAINGFDPNTFINRMCSERLRFMHAIRGGRAWITFGKGWMARVTDLRNYALALRAGGTAPEAPDLASTVTPKALASTPFGSGGRITLAFPRSSGRNVPAGIGFAPAADGIVDVVDQDRAGNLDFDGLGEGSLAIAGAGLEREHRVVAGRTGV